MKPLCFVLMPFGTKTDGNKKEINFDTVYNDFIHKPMYERLMFCQFAVADLSFANANVFYELGIRHALKPFTTISIFEVGTKIPFDTAPLRTFPYVYENNAVQDVATKITALASYIKEGVDAQTKDSPIGQLITAYKFPDLDYLLQDADSFRKNAIAAKNQKEELNQLVKQWKDTGKTKPATDDEKKKAKEDQQKIVDKIRSMQQAEGTNLKFNLDLLYALINAYKSVSAFKEVTEMLQPLLDTGDNNNPFDDNIYLRQQLSLAYNKIKNRDDAKRVLEPIIEKYGPDPETNGLLGAVYKGLSDDERKNNNEDQADSYNADAVDAYLPGFEADPRNYYPGVNALTLMFLGNEKDERFDKFMPLVTYAVERELRTKPKDYWVLATALELAVLDMKAAEAKSYAAKAINSNPDDWMKETTAANLKKIYGKALQTSDEQSLQWLKDMAIKLYPAAFA
jgi:tetratricopeptide (TPR) repeat protein